MVERKSDFDDPFAREPSEWLGGCLGYCSLEILAMIVIAAIASAWCVV